MTMRAMDHPEIARVARHSVAHARNNSFETVADIARVPATNYTDPQRFQAEVDRIFRRLPLMLAPSCELPNPGDFKTLEITGIPLLLVRGKDGKVRSFINSCTHRGTMVALEPAGNAKRFTCPYHGWTFGQQGELIAIASAGDFGEVDKSCLSLKALPVAERAGLIFGSLDPKGTVDIDQFLCGYDAMLGKMGFQDWHLFDSRVLKGPNWKIAYDGYLDFYHLPVLHKETLNANGTMGNRALYYAWGPHQRLISPFGPARELARQDESEWADEMVMDGVWTIFPCISIASFNGGGYGVLISQLLPGAVVGESLTRQIYLMREKPSPEQEAAARQQFDFLEVVVRDEDYATGLRQQRALDHGTLSHVLFGRNEGGAQVFHRWTDMIIAASDAELPALFANANRA